MAWAAYRLIGVSNEVKTIQIWEGMPPAHLCLSPIPKSRAEDCHASFVANGRDKAAKGDSAMAASCTASARPSPSRARPPDAGRCRHMHPPCPLASSASTFHSLSVTSVLMVQAAQAVIWQVSSLAEEGRKGGVQSADRHIKDGTMQMGPALVRSWSCRLRTWEVLGPSPSSLVGPSGLLGRRHSGADLLLRTGCLVCVCVMHRGWLGRARP